MLTAQSQLTTQARLWLEQLPSAIALFDHQMHYILASFRWREILNLGDRHLSGCSYTQTCPTLPANWPTIHQHCLSGSSQSWKTDCPQDKNPQPSSLRWKATPWYDQAGKVGGLTLSVEEVLEDKKLCQSLGSQEFERFQQLAENVPGMIYQFRLDPDGTRIFPYVSSGCHDLYELKPEQVQQQSQLLFEMVHPDDLPLLQTAINHSAETLTKWEFEWRIITQTGQQKWLKGIAQPQLQPDGAILWDGCMIDISDRKTVEAQLQQSQQLLQLVLDNIPQLIFWKDRNLVYQGCNQNFACVAGVGSPENIVGKTDYDLAWTDEQANWYRHCDRQVMTSGQRSLHIIETQQQADGKQAWLDTNKIPLRDSQNQVIGILGTIEDITSRKQAEETFKRYNEELETRVAERTAQLQRSLQELTNLKFALDQSAIVSITDIQGKITYVNDTFCQISGYSREELIGVSHRIVNSAHHCKPFFRQMWRTIARGKVWQGEIKNRAKDGLHYWVHTTIVPLLDETNKPYQYISIRHDISDRKQAEMELQESQSQLQAVLDYAPAVIFLKNLEGQYILVNRECERVLKTSRGEVIGKTDYDLFPAEIAHTIQHNDQQALNTGGVIYSEETIPLPDGEHIYETIKFSVADANGNFYATGGVSIDITTRKTAEDALKQSEARFQRLAANIPGMLYQLRLDGDATLSFPYVSSGCRDLYGIEPEQIQQDASLLKIHPEDESEVMAAVRFSAQTLQDWKSEWRMILPSGGVKWVQAISRPQRQANGSTLWNGCLIDISDRKRTEEQLQQFQQRLSLMIEQTPLAVIEWNPNMEVSAWNPAAERIFGYARSEALGRYMDFILPESAREQVQGVTAELLVQQGGYYSLNENLRKEGQTIICEWYNTPLVTPDGEVIGIASHALDITDRKQAELQLQQQAETLQKTLQELRRTQAQMIQSEKMSSLGQMVAGVAHEINNPVSFIHGNLTHAHDYAQDLFKLVDLYQQHYPQPPADIQELLEEIELEFLKQDFTKLLKSMKIGTERIRETVLSLRNFSRLDEAEFKRADLHEGINSTLMILQSRLPDIEVITEYAQLPKVECYPGQLNQVFLNILDNAIDVLDKMPDHKQIRIQTEAINSDWVRILIFNSGPEILEAICTKVFDPFFTTKPVGQGTGLGLSISYQIITDKHSGKINCYPISGEGTEFVIEIPVHQTH